MAPDAKKKIVFWLVIVGLIIAVALPILMLLYAKYAGKL